MGVKEVIIEGVRKARRRRGRDPANAAVPELQFGHSTDRAGFTPAGIAAFSDLRPAAVVRELIQNSLDAALIEAREPCAHVRFERSVCTLDEIPGIESYRTAFRRAVKEQTPSGSARAVVERIRADLAGGVARHPVGDRQRRGAGRQADVGAAERRRER